MRESDVVPVVAKRSTEADIQSSSNVSMDYTSSNALVKYQLLGCKGKRKKHNRRTSHEIKKEFVCPYENCDKFFGSEGS